MNQYLYISVDLKKLESFQYPQCPFPIYRDESAAAIVLGNLYDAHCNRLTPFDVCSLYKKHAEKLESMLDGVYTVILLDFCKRKIYVFQDFFGGNQYIYLYAEKNRLVISNSLKQIITSNKRRWALNSRAAHSFIKHGYCVGKDTLVQGIVKIPGGKYLDVDAAKGSLSFRSYPSAAVTSVQTSAESYDKLFEKICLSSAPNPPVTTLSRGYDSNFILHQLEKLRPQRIDSFCIGSNSESSEIPDTKKICQHYGNIHLHTQLVDGNIINALPEIMCILDFSLYECGIFLQYALNKFLHENHVRRIMLGECADQLLNYNTYHPLHQRLSQLYHFAKNHANPFHPFTYSKPYSFSYDFGAYVIIKKNGILANHFGIEPEYPYVRKAYINFARSVVQSGFQNKRFHKQAVSSLLPDAVSSILKKLPGTTDQSILFTGDISFEHIKSIAAHSKYYRVHSFDHVNTEIDYHLRILCLELFRIMYLENPEQYLHDHQCPYELKQFFPLLIGSSSAS